MKVIALIIKSGNSQAYSPVGHVVTGNLDIVDKLGNFDQLKRVIQLGYKCRVQSSNVTWGRIKRDLMVTVESLKNKIMCDFSSISYHYK